MAKKRIGDKAERVLKLLLGLRNKKIASALATRGFGAEDLEEGFALLRGVTGVALAVLPAAPANPAIILDTDRWENEWFPVADATLARHYPEIHAGVFLNLSQTEGAGVIIFAKAEAAMWAWYLEWGAIARAAIKDRGLLRQLGFLSSSPGGGGSAGRQGDEGTQGDEDDEPAPSGGAPA